MRTRIEEMSSICAKVDLEPQGAGTGTEIECLGQNVRCHARIQLRSPAYINPTHLNPVWLVPVGSRVHEGDDVVRRDKRVYISGSWHGINLQWITASCKQQ